MYASAAPASVISRIAWASPGPSRKCRRASPRNFTLSLRPPTHSLPLNSRMWFGACRRPDQRRATRPVGTTGSAGDRSRFHASFEAFSGSSSEGCYVSCVTLWLVGSAARGFQQAWIKSLRGAKGDTKERGNNLLEFSRLARKGRETFSPADGGDPSGARRPAELWLDLRSGGRRGLETRAELWLSSGPAQIASRSEGRH